MLEALPPLARNSAILERLRAHIAEQRLRPGDRLPSENELAEGLGVSRPAVREALRALEGLGMVEVLHGKGRFLRQFNMEPIAASMAHSLLIQSSSLRDLLDVRRALEVAFLPEAVASLDEATTSELRAAVERMRELYAAGEPFISEDACFHRALFSRVDNAVLRELLDAFWAMFKVVRLDQVAPPRDASETILFHARILEHVAAGDVEKARAVLIEHFADVKQRVEKLEAARAEEEVTGRP
jgi:DNA-binding FadR family transcriptional regulator